MKASTIKELMERGIHVVVTKSHKAVERYHMLNNGNVVITYQGINVCMYCGRVRTAPCSCAQTLEVLSMTGAHRHINEVAQNAADVRFDEKYNKLFIVEASVA